MGENQRQERAVKSSLFQIFVQVLIATITNILYIIHGIVDG